MPPNRRFFRKKKGRSWKRGLKKSSHVQSDGNVLITALGGIGPLMKDRFETVLDPAYPSIGPIRTLVELEGALHHVATHAAEKVGVVVWEEMGNGRKANILRMASFIKRKTQKDLNATKAIYGEALVREHPDLNVYRRAYDSIREWVADITDPNNPQRHAPPPDGSRLLFGTEGPVLLPMLPEIPVVPGPGGASRLAEYRALQGGRDEKAAVARVRGSWRPRRRGLGRLSGTNPTGSRGSGKAQFFGPGAG